MSFDQIKWLLVGSRMDSGWGLVTRKTKPWLEAWNFQPCLPSPSSWKRRGARDWGSIWSCLCDEDFIKVLKYGVQRAAKLVNTSIVWYAVRVVHPNSMETEAPALDPSGSHPLCCLHLALHLCPLSYFLLHSKPVNVSVFLSSVSCFSRWLNPRRWVLGTSNLYQVDRGCRQHGDLWLVSEVGGRLVGLSP